MIAPGAGVHFIGEVQNIVAPPQIVTCSGIGLRTIDNRKV
jgi:hypothetical protein